MVCENEHFDSTLDDILSIAKVKLFYHFCFLDSSYVQLVEFQNMFCQNKVGVSRLVPWTRVSNNGKDEITAVILLNLIGI